ncbi:MAG: imidazolonepropionase [Chitinophagaceae bacterium]
MLITNLGMLVNTGHSKHPLRGAGMKSMQCIPRAWLRTEHGKIVAIGSMDTFRPEDTSGEDVWDAQGKWCFPSWCDSHTHLVFAASREEEFVMKICGKSYAEIAAAGGGILNSARKLREMSEDELYHLAACRLHELILLGTGAIEIKSGYGLTTEAELKMLRVIKRLKETFPIPVKASFLGAHALPELYKENKEGYLRLIEEEMLPAIAKEGLADYIDAFCEQGFFSNEDTARLMEAGARFGLKARIHANQLSASGAVETAVAHHAVSVDHLEVMDEAAIAALTASNTIGTLLPTAAYFLRMDFQPARALLDAGCAIALASDFNPGSSPSGNMNTVVSMSCIQMKMFPEEAIHAATTNAAFALELEGELGSIAEGKRANFFFTRPLPSLAYLPYAFGSNLISAVMLNGKWYPSHVTSEE